MDEEMTLEQLGARRLVLRDDLKTVTERLKAKSLQELADGRAEAEVARAARVDRMTLREWQGKRDRKNLGARVDSATASV